MAWDPGCYERFKGEREQPFDDLLALLGPGSLGRIVDLGCGTGELTARLAGRLAAHDVLGIDSSPEMLARTPAVVQQFVEQSRLRAGPAVRLHFRRQSIEELLGRTPPREYDLVFSHAALHWIDDHPALVPRLMLLLRPGGQLLVQVPSNHHHPAWAIAAAVAASPPFDAVLRGPPRSSPVLDIAAYATLLHAAGASRITVVERVYPHLLEAAPALATWMRGTTLVPLLERLPEALRDPFIEAFAARLTERFPERPLFYPFRRTLLAATAR